MNIKTCFGISSCKGGVGKSTISCNIAITLANQGYKVGLLDADVYGPSQPRMLGVSGRPASVGGDMVAPLQNYGISLMSMGLLVPDDTAMIWRGPMVQSALTQMLNSVAWGNLDIIVIDLPPGTGDIQISLAQQVNLAGAVIVSTPQDIALLDVVKALTMFQKANVPVLGMIENIDENVGKIIKTLKEIDKYEDTIIIFLSDNGPNGNRWNNELKERKGSTNEGGVRVPFFIQWPNKIKSGIKIKQVTSALDVFPTLTDLIDSPTGINFDGKSFKKYIKNPDLLDNQRKVFSFWNNRLSVRNNEYILDYNDKLYDLSNDHSQYYAINPEGNKNQMSLI